MFERSIKRYSHLLIFLFVCGLLLSGCGLFGSDESEPTPEPEERAIVPTFTPTPVGAEPSPTPLPPLAPAESATPAQPAEPAEVAAEPTAAPVEEPTPTPEAAPTDTPAPKASAFVNIDIANVRNGPGTNYGLAGSVNRDQQLDIIGKSPDGTWWEVCCVNGQQAWIFGDLVRTENTENVAVSTNIPDPPPVAAAPPPAPPTDTPVPAPQEPDPAPVPVQGDPDAGPCGGDDGCKFKLRGGPSTGGNGGLELKMQFLFAHGGRGDEAQGSYFVVLKKEGVKLPVSDGTRSVAKTKSAGQLGEYNYEYKLGTGDLPGNSVAGNYTIWVLDGNGERDSEIFNFNIGDPQQGLLWIKFDQS